LRVAASSLSSCTAISIKTSIVDVNYTPFIVQRSYISFLFKDGGRLSVCISSCRKAKLIEQHIKLKGQLKELATKMDEIVEKEK